MDNHPHITVQQVQANAADQSFKRGESYYRNGAISDTVKRGNEIEGFCEGSQASPYHVRVTLSVNGIEKTSCTCQYEYGGYCKHIIALLLTYIHKPDSFEERPAVEETLTARDKDQLIALIHRMIERYPDLQSLVDRPVPGRQSRQSPLDTNSFRKEIRSAFRRIHEYDGWDDYSDNNVESTIYSILETGREFASQNDWRNASAIYRAVIEELVANADDLMIDEEGEIVAAANDVLADLAQCLDPLSDDEGERWAIFESLLTAFKADVDIGGIGFADDSTDFILHNVKQADISRIRDWINGVKKPGTHDGYRDWETEAYESFLMELDLLDNTDPETTLKRLRDQKLYQLLVTRLLEMKRLDEAVAVIENDITNPYERLQALPFLTASGRDDDAIRIAENMEKRSDDERIIQWLLQRYSARGDQQKYFDWQLRRLKQHPYLPYYIELKAAAEPLGSWEDVRWDLIGWLEKQRHDDLLTRIYVNDEEWDHAWNSLKRITQSKHAGWFSSHSMEVEIAVRSRHLYPERALPIIQKQVQSAIDQRSRGGYQHAAEYLVMLRELYQKTGDVASWETLVSDIKGKYKKLRALQDELRKAGL